MAIVRMKRLSVIGLHTDKEAVVEKLMRLGAVEISDPDALTGDMALAGFVASDGDEAAVAGLESSISRIKSAIDFISKYDARKRAPFEPKKVVDSERCASVSENREAVWKAVGEAEGYIEELSELKTEQNRLTTLVGSLEPWASLDIPLDMLSAKSSAVLIGTVPATADIAKLREELGEKVVECHLELINTDREQSYLLIIYHKSRSEDAGQILKKYEFNAAAFPGLAGTVKANVEEARRQIKETEDERARIGKQAAALAGERENLEILHDILVIERDRKKVLSRLARTDRVFMLEGWLPAEKAEEVEKSILETAECIIDIRDPGKDEEFPILLRNNSLVRPYELVTELYSLPSTRNMDPNLFMAPFFFLFFGLMVSDAGYGIVIALATGIMLKKFKPRGMAYKIIKLAFFGGISTFIWGALLGGWFGNLVDAVTGGKYTIKPIWFNPMDDPMKLLIWSFVFGGLHILTGLGLKAYLLIRDGKLLDAVYDVFSWYLVLIGLVMLAGGGIIAQTGKYMAMAGAAILVLTQGRGEKNVFKRYINGILSLYSVTGFLSDVLSYSRLLALGLATGVIASVINTMGTLFGINVLGIIALAIIFIIGTVFNIAINVLGAYVHSSRLQYVEFFGKFYEGGGRKFEPFGIKTKYINLTDRR